MLLGRAVESMTDGRVMKAMALSGSEHRRRNATEIVTVTADNFVEAETARMFDGIVLNNGGINRWGHNRQPVALDQHTAIRMNRDTLYSSAVVDISKGATLPDAGERNMSLMVLNEGHYINAVYHDEGSYKLTVGEFGTDHVALVVRAFVDPDDPKDLTRVRALQDQIKLKATWAKPY